MLTIVVAVQQAGSQQKKRSAPAVDDKRMRALAAAMVRESEREALQGIRLELEQVCLFPGVCWAYMLTEPSRLAS